MRDEAPSRTAHLVALGRAMGDLGLSHVEGFRDPTARHFLNAAGARSLAKAEAALRAGGKGMRLEVARAMADRMALRTSAIDAAVRDAMGGGATQLVIVGAGYDGRAWRMPALQAARVFELDHPATQGYKREHAAGLGPAIGEVAFVPIDFEREPLDSVLDAAGHDRASPTCWIWEGVVMYLTRAAVRTTLETIAERSAPGSTLIVNYHTRPHRSLLARLILRLMGEPQISHWTPAEMAADLASAGFTAREDTGMLDWNQRFAAGRARVEGGAHMRVVVARRG